MTVWFGLHMPSFTFTGARPAELFDRVVTSARTAEDAGFGVVTVMDHFYQIGGVGQPEEPMLEGWTALGALARETSRVRLGTLVSGVTYRNPALVAKMVTTLDVISGGRAILGLGAAWNEVEHAGYGFDFPPVRERMDRLDEALTIVRAMLRGERPTFDGRYYHARDALNSPPPIQAGGPPVLVGGGGEQRTLRIAAAHADMTHWFALGMDALRHKTEVLERYCEEIDRDPSTIERTMQAPVVVGATEEEARAMLERLPEDRRPNVDAGTPAQAAEMLQPYIEAGFTGFTFNNTIYRAPEAIAICGELLALVGRDR